MAILATNAVYDLQHTAMTSRAYRKLVGAGLGLGVLTGFGTAGAGNSAAAFVGGVADLLWAAKIGPASPSADPLASRFLDDDELEAFQAKLDAYAKVEQDEALALAKVAIDIYPRKTPGVIPDAFRADLEKALKQARAA